MASTILVLLLLIGALLYKVRMRKAAERAGTLHKEGAVSRTHPLTWALTLILFVLLGYGVWYLATSPDRMERELLRQNVDLACQQAANYSDCMARAHQRP